MEKNNFHYIAVLLDMLYGLELEDEELEELGLIAWELIGNKNTRLYKYTTCIDPSDNSIKLPCNATSVESVTALTEDWNRVTNYSNQGDLKSAFIEQDIEGQKIFTNRYYISGKLLPYEQVGDTLYFRKNYGTVNILYKGIIADEDGLPELSDKEALAIATYLAYVDKYKESLKTSNGDLLKMSETLHMKWLKQCDQARVTHLSQNDLNEILDIKTRWDRKSYGFSYKPVK